MFYFTPPLLAVQSRNNISAENKNFYFFIENDIKAFSFIDADWTQKWLLDQAEDVW